MRRKPNNFIDNKTLNNSINSLELKKDDSIEAVELFGEQIVVATAKAIHMKNGEEYIVSAQVAMTLIAKGKVILK